VRPRCASSCAARPTYTGAGLAAGAGTAPCIPGPDVRDARLRKYRGGGRGLPESVNQSVSKAQQSTLRRLLFEEAAMAT
jgi:hypothetical protein